MEEEIFDKEERKRHQCIFIRGGEAFDKKEEFYEYLRKREYNPYKKWRTWKDWLEWSLSEKFDSFSPIMPNKQWADYEAWKIWFEKLFPYINKDKESKIILIGQSLGATFLAKYLSENKFPKKIDQLYFISLLFEDDGLVGEKTGSFKLDKSKLKNIEPQANKVFLFHSKDDNLVPIYHAEKFAKFLDKAKFYKFDKRGHFSQPAFMEILQTINENL